MDIVLRLIVKQYRLMVLGLVIVVGSYCYADSLYQPESYRSVVGTDRSLEVGNILTVVIYESSSASSSTSTDASTGTEVSVSATDGTNNPSAGVNANSSFNGGGEINRTGKIVANVSATIEGVNDAGAFLISGEQEIKLNNEVQKITVKGFVRPEDITEANTVISTRIANLEIDFIGDGLLTSSEKPGIITRFFKWLF